MMNDQTKETNRVTVNLKAPTPYLEKHSKLSSLRRKLTHQYPIGIIKKHSSDILNVKIFDIGTGSGTFLAEVKRSLPTAKLAGIEYDPRLVDAANKRLGAAVVCQGNAEEFHIEETMAYDVVTSFHVIEHLYEPEKLIANAKKLLKNDGILLIATPNDGCIAHRKHGDDWQGIRDDHVNLKSAKEWDEIITAHGFKQIRIGTTFFSGLHLMKRFPLNLLNGVLSLIFGTLRWELGESFIGVYRK